MPVLLRRVGVLRCRKEGTAVNRGDRVRIKATGEKGRIIGFWEGGILAGDKPYDVSVEPSGLNRPCSEDELEKEDE